MTDSSELDSLCSVEQLWDMAPQELQNPAGRAGGVQSVQTPRLGEPLGNEMGAKRCLRDRAAAASEEDDRP